ncbi:hypothetical protein HS088_TW12G00190 [Tripterygium wilfordii]|uniref:Uncharacterized protein n=1 Tax=Tripterygium wilfordii TaxID=458696 RepID=A0A7J7CY48_TRIWF|nr:uncharacterized protein LOC120010075 [Tripterygium wilfordii]KAF5738994.1 hypothetical protein HS088_TW12G00190 [Tripterygium wilfordii]
MAAARCYGSFQRVAIEGSNIGASMFIRRGIAAAEPEDNCCINIYINNNVQGVINSVLLGSEVSMRDPGVRLSFKDVALDERWLRSKRWSWRDYSCCVILFSFFFLIMLLLLLFI